MASHRGPGDATAEPSRLEILEVDPSHLRPSETSFVSFCELETREKKKEEDRKPLLDIHYCMSPNSNLDGPVLGN